MGVTGLCQICGAKPAAHRCANCGSVVCGEHFVAAVERCTECAGPGAGRQL